MSTAKAPFPRSPTTSTGSAPTAGARHPARPSAPRTVKVFKLPSRPVHALASQNAPAVKLVPRGARPDAAGSEPIGAEQRIPAIFAHQETDARRLLRSLGLEIEDETEARRLLRSMGRDPSQTVTVFRLPSQVIHNQQWGLGIAGSLFVIPLLCAIVALSISWTLEAFLASLSFATVLLTALLVYLTGSPTRLQVAGDGLLISWLRQKRFIRYSDVTAIDRYEARVRGRHWIGIEVTLASSERLRIPITDAKPWALRETILLERIHKAMGSFHRGDAAWNTSILRRGSLTYPEWIRFLRAMGTGGAAAYRTAFVTPAMLWQVAEDPGADPVARAASMVALRADATADTHARLQAIVRTTAAPRLRAAMKAALLESDKNLVETLAALEAEHTAD